MVILYTALIHQGQGSSYVRSATGWEARGIYTSLDIVSRVFDLKVCLCRSSCLEVPNSLYLDLRPAVSQRFPLARDNPGMATIASEHQNWRSSEPREDYDRDTGRFREESPMRILAQSGPLVLRSGRTNAAFLTPSWISNQG